MKIKVSLYKTVYVHMAIELISFSCATGVIITPELSYQA
jgi:hypothetical protein